MGSDKYQPPGPLFVGNFDYEAHPRDVEKLIDRYGDVERIDMKMGFAFVYMYDKRDGDDAIKALDGTEWGDRKRRRLKVEWARGDGEVKRREEQRRKQQAPTSTLFVVNFDVTRVRESDLAHEFNKYGRTKRVQIKKNFAFIQYDTVEDAERALKGTHLTDIGGRTISVEYVAREADGRRPWEQPARETSYDRRSDRGGGGSSRRSLSPRRRSPSRTPPRRRSPSPDYGRRSAGRDGSLDRSRDRSRTPRRDVGRDRSRTPPSRRSPRRSPPRSP